MHDQAFVLRVLKNIMDLQGSAKQRVSTWTRIHGVFTAISEELHDVPLYYPLAAMVRNCFSSHGFLQCWAAFNDCACLQANTLHCVTPKLKSVQAALVNLGSVWWIILWVNIYSADPIIINTTVHFLCRYRVSCCHSDPCAVKTDAPPEVFASSHRSLIPSTSDSVWDFLCTWKGNVGYISALDQSQSRQSEEAQQRRHLLQAVERKYCVKQQPVLPTLYLKCLTRETDWTGNHHQLDHLGGQTSCKAPGGS